MNRIRELNPHDLLKYLGRCKNVCEVSYGNMEEARQLQKHKQKVN